ncbi:hypothetical protein THOD04_30370 [Vibrio owensii]|nr:hypothetical protein THOD04_30370 [Vibrio owensii]
MRVWPYFSYKLNRQQKRLLISVLVAYIIVFIGYLLLLSYVVECQVCVRSLAS